MANFVSYANATELMQGVADKFDELGGAYIPKGSLAFSALPVLTEAMRGYVWNITDDFTTDSRFVDGADKDYPAGTNVVVVEVEESGTKSYMLDVLGNFIDIAAIENRIDGTQAMTAPEFDETQDYAVGDVVTYHDKLWTCSTAHDAGVWDSDHFTETNVTSLINAAEPDALTSDQMTALLALLD